MNSLTTYLSPIVKNMESNMCPKTPQQNGVIERKNRTLQEMAGTMINE